MDNENMDLIFDEDSLGTPTDTEDPDWDLDLSEAFAVAEREEAEEADKGEGNAEEEKCETSTAGEAEAPESAAATFTLNHLGHLQTVDRKDMVALAQKGLDYDFVKAKLGETREKLRAYEEKTAWKPEPGAPTAITENKFTPGSPEDTAAEELPQGDAPVLRRELHQRETGPVPSPGEEHLRKKGEVLEIMKYIPDFNGEVVAPEVWDEVRKGSTLFSAYLIHENRKLRTELAAARQEKGNREKTPGSVSTAGNRNETMDPFLIALSERD